MGITLQDIARRANVAVSTVSRVLSNDPNVRISARTRHRVLSIASQLGYRPNTHARVLTGAKAPLISLIVVHRSDYVTNHKVWSLHAALARLGRETMVADASNVASLWDFVETILMAAPEAVVFLHPEQDILEVDAACRKLWEQGTHVLLVDTCDPDVPEDIPADSVDIDRTGGALLAAQHLIERGHRHIGLITHENAFGRREGYADALASAGIDERYMECYDGPDEIERVTAFAEGAAQRLLTSYPQITAVFCHSDMAAAAAMYRLLKMGLRVPDDVAIVGWDNDPWTRYLPVPLTTVVQPVDELSEIGVQMLQARLGGSRAPWRRELVAPTLLVRESSAALPDDWAAPVGDSRSDDPHASGKTP